MRQITRMEILRVLSCIICISLAQSQGNTCGRGDNDECEISETGDIHGSVNVGYCVTNPETNKTDITPQLITITENVPTASLPVYFLLVNNSQPDLNNCIALDEDVLVSCSIKSNYTDGESLVEFVDTVISTGQDIGDIPFSVIEQGRAVEVECSGETINPQSTTLLFSTTLSVGVIGSVAVKKSPQVSICDDIVVVPNSLLIETGQIQLQLSEPVADNNVTVSCEISGITQAIEDSWMYIIFEDVYATIGTVDILMTYNIFRRGSLVLVSCRAESENDGTQYLRNTSLSAATVFTLDTGSVQLVPQVSLIPTPRFSAFVVLNNPIKANEGEVVYSCYLNAVNDSIQAKEIAENPVCKTPDEVLNRPTAADPVCVPQGNITCPPDNGPGSNSTRGFWILDESELIFTEGNVYKTITARLDSETTQYVGALVLTCCAAPDLNTSPRFINTSAALLMLSNVKGYRPINWTEAGESTIKETLFANPAYVEMSPCPCDNVQNHCETDCCCDVDCTDNDLATFTCTPGIPGGDFSINSEFSCTNVTLYTPDYWPFLCVQVSNSPYLGLYYSSVYGIRDFATFTVRKAYFTDSTFTSYRDLGARTLEFVSDDNNVRLYKNGYPVEQLYSKDVRGFLALPQRVPGGSCLWTSPLKFQEDVDSSCQLTSHQDLCQETSILSAHMFLQGSSVSYPACPDAPQVVSKYRSGQVAPTDVIYYCADDLSAYRVSDTIDLLHPDKPSLFSRDKKEEDERTSYPRCEWDDGYTRPPVPLYDDTTQRCHNAVLDVQYQLFWRGGEIVSVKATLLLGSIGLSQNVDLEEEDTTVDFVPPPPITAPPTDDGGLLTSMIFENGTEFITNITEVFENYTFTLGTEETLGTDGTTLATQPKVTTNPRTTPALPTTTPAAPTTPIPTTEGATTPSGLPSPPTNSPSRMGTTILPTFTTPVDVLQEETNPAAFIQHFSARFIHQPETTYNPDTGQKLDQEQSERSGNPGYIVGSRVLTGVALYDYLPDFDCAENSTDNCTFPESLSGINGTFVIVDDEEDNRLKVWGTGSGSLCSESTIMDVPYGEDLISGCLLRLGLAQLQNCSVLRETLIEELSSLVPSNVIGKRGNADVSIAEDWAPVFGFDDEPYETVNSTSTPGEETVTTPDPLTTRFPGQRYVQDPTPTQIADQLSGVCYDMPTGINMEILIAGVGENRGTVQHEILGARLTYTTSKLQLQCSAALGATCRLYGTHVSGNETDFNGNSTNSNKTSWVQSFHVTSTVTYTKVPAQEPKPLKLYRIGNSDGLCLQDVCWNSALYPFTRDFQGDSFQYVLGVTLLTTFLSMGYLAVAQPWVHLP